MDFNEATIVNKFKKEMHLFNADMKPADTLYPSFPSTGNRLEKQSGKAIFFFSTEKEALKYAIGKGIDLEFEEYIRNVRSALNNKYKDRKDILDYVFDYFKVLSDICVGGELPPIHNVFGKDLKFYGLDDRKVFPAYPVCYYFIEYLKTSKRKIYVRECICDTKDIKHGHSQDFREFTVFKPVKVYKNHEYTLGEAFSQINVTYLTDVEGFKKYANLIVNNNKKDLLRKMLMYRDWEDRLSKLKKETREKDNIKKENVIVNENDILRDINDFISNL